MVRPSGADHFVSIPQADGEPQLCADRFFNCSLMQRHANSKCLESISTARSASPDAKALINSRCSEIES